MSENLKDIRKQVNTNSMPGMPSQAVSVPKGPLEGGPIWKNPVNAGPIRKGNQTNKKSGIPGAESEEEREERERERVERLLDQRKQPYKPYAKMTDGEKLNEFYERYGIARENLDEHVIKPGDYSDGNIVSLCSKYPAYSLQDVTNKNQFDEEMREEFNKKGGVQIPELKMMDEVERSTFKLRQELDRGILSKKERDRIEAAKKRYDDSRKKMYQKGTEIEERKKQQQSLLRQKKKAEEDRKNGTDTRGLGEYFHEYSKTAGELDKEQKRDKSSVDFNRLNKKAELFRSKYVDMNKVGTAEFNIRYAELMKETLDYRSNNSKKLFSLKRNLRSIQAEKLQGDLEAIFAKSGWRMQYEIVRNMRKAGVPEKNIKDLKNKAMHLNYGGVEEDSKKKTKLDDESFDAAQAIRNANLMMRGLSFNPGRKYAGVASKEKQLVFRKMNEKFTDIELTDEGLEASEKTQYYDRVLQNFLNVSYDPQKLDEAYIKNNLESLMLFTRLHSHIQKLSMHKSFRDYVKNLPDIVKKRFDNQQKKVKGGQRNTENDTDLDKILINYCGSKGVNYTPHLDRSGSDIGEPFIKGDITTVKKDYAKFFKKGLSDYKLRMKGKTDKFYEDTFISVKGMRMMKDNRGVDLGSTPIMVMSEYSDRNKGKEGELEDKSDFSVIMDYMDSVRISKDANFEKLRKAMSPMGLLSRISKQEWEKLHSENPDVKSYESHLRTFLNGLDPVMMELEKAKYFEGTDVKNQIARAIQHNYVYLRNIYRRDDSIVQSRSSEKKAEAPKVQEPVIVEMAEIKSEEAPREEKKEKKENKPAEAPREEKKEKENKPAQAPREEKIIKSEEDIQDKRTERQKKEDRLKENIEFLKEQKRQEKEARDREDARVLKQFKDSIPSHEELSKKLFGDDEDDEIGQLIHHKRKVVKKKAKPPQDNPQNNPQDNPQDNPQNNPQDNPQNNDAE